MGGEKARVAVAVLAAAGGCGDVDRVRGSAVEPLPPVIAWWPGEPPVTAPAPPARIEHPCPEGWIPEPNEAGWACLPWVDGLAPRCSDTAMRAVPGTGRCLRVGSACPDGDWPPIDDLETAFVRPGADGIGTRLRPYGTLQAALAARQPRVALSVGRHVVDSDVVIDHEVEIVGACASEVLLEARPGGTIDVRVAGQARFENASIAVDALVVEPLAALTVEDSILRVGASGWDVLENGELAVRRSRLIGSAINGEGAWSRVAGRMTLEESMVDQLPGPLMASGLDAAMTVQSSYFAGTTADDGVVAALDGALVTIRASAFGTGVGAWASARSDPSTRCRVDTVPPSSPTLVARSLWIGDPGPSGRPSIRVEGDMSASLVGVWYPRARAGLLRVDEASVEVVDWSHASRSAEPRAGMSPGIEVHDGGIVRATRLALNAVPGACISVHDSCLSATDLHLSSCGEGVVARGETRVEREPAVVLQRLFVTGTVGSILTDASTSLDVSDLDARLVVGGQAPHLSLDEGVLRRARMVEPEVACDATCRPLVDATLETLIFEQAYLDSGQFLEVRQGAIVRMSGSVVRTRRCSSDIATEGGIRFDDSLVAAEGPCWEAAAPTSSTFAVRASNVSIAGSVLRSSGPPAMSVTDLRTSPGAGFGQTEFPGSSFSWTDVVLVHTGEATPYGLLLGDATEGALTRVRLESHATVPLLVRGSGTDVSMLDVEVVASRGVPVLSACSHGRALQVERGAKVDAERLRVTPAYCGSGLLVTGAGTHFVGVDVAVVGQGEDGSGIGLASTRLAFVELQRFEVRDHAVAGVQRALSGRLALMSGLVAGNAIGLNPQDDLGLKSVTDGTDFRDNGVNISRTSVQVPDPTAF